MTLKKQKKKMINGEKRLQFLLALQRMIPGISYQLQTVRYQVKTEKLAVPIRLALLTDLHGCRYGEGQKELLAVLEREKPDAVLLGGDLFDDRMPVENTVSLLLGIGRSYPCFCVTGNHEYYGCDGSEYLAILKEQGIRVLENCRTEEYFRGQKIRICGVSDMWSYKESENPQKAYLCQVENMINTQKDGVFTIFLAHRPEFAEAYEKTGADLVLCGHAHGGQWRIPGVLNGFFAPGQGFFPKYAGGEYDLNGCRMIVSRGLSRERTRVPRIWNPPELVMVDLTPEN